MQCSVYQQPPFNFKKELDVVGVFCDWKEYFLLLHRSLGTLQEDTWGLPAGKVEPGEGFKTAAVREVKEETALVLTEEDLVFNNVFYVVNDNSSFAFHVYRYQIEEKNVPKVDLAKREHQDFRWLKLEEALALPLIAGGEEILTLCH